MPAKITDYKAHFWTRVDKSGGPAACWPWQGARKSTGYGQYCIERRPFQAHRAAYMFSKGEIPEGMQVMHSCDTPPCCNPSHLSLGTSHDNHLDMLAKGRQAKNDNPSPETRKKMSLSQTNLTEQQLLTIRDTVLMGRRTKEIAELFNVDKNIVSSIKTGRKFQWLSKEAHHVSN
jgi:hypothetical protein